MSKLWSLIETVNMRTELNMIQNAIITEEDSTALNLLFADQESVIEELLSGKLYQDIRVFDEISNYSEFCNESRKHIAQRQKSKFSVIETFISHNGSRITQENSGVLKYILATLGEVI